MNKKRIFISDLHMSDHRSYHPETGNTPYAPLSDERRKTLVRFLQEQVIRPSEVEELIILGDIFDQWLCPTEYAPPSYEEIIKLSENQPIIKKLREIATEKKLTYVAGNHDMMGMEAVFRENIHKNIIYIGHKSNPEHWPRYVNETEAINAEHGHLFSISCSPDNTHHKNSHLAIGQFFSRMWTHKIFHSTGTSNYKEAIMAKIAQFIEMTPPEIGNGNTERLELESEELDGISPKTLDWIIKNSTYVYDWYSHFLNFFIESCELKDESSFDMTNIEGYNKNYKMSDFKKEFAGWLFNWHNQNSKTVNFFNCQGMFLDLSEFFDAAAWGHFQGKYRRGRTPSVVILGHTHEAKFKAYHEDGTFAQLDISDQAQEPKRFKYIYANTGTWISDHIPTYVETECTEDKRTIVRLYQYKDSPKDPEIIAEGCTDNT